MVIHATKLMGSEIPRRPLDPTEEDRKLQERARLESGPVKTTLDLDSFIVFKADLPGGTCGRWCSINE